MINSTFFTLASYDSEDVCPQLNSFRLVMRSPQWSSPSEALSPKAFSPKAFGPKAFSLENQHIHLWQADLNLTEPHLQQLWALLSGDEQARAQRLRSPTDQNAFVAARGILRILLGRYLRVAPETLEFCYGDQGKPTLAVELNPANLCFNLSHSGGLALYAIALTQVGVDIEQVRPDLNQSAIVKRFFSSLENTFLEGLPQRDRCGAFFKLWTCKEAYIKAKGEGVFQSLNQPEFSHPDFLAGNQNSANSVAGQPWLQIDADPQMPWFVAQLDPGPGYAAALAVAGQPGLIRCWQWNKVYLMRQF